MFVPWGGESGRTDRVAVSVDEEAARVVPLVERLAGAGVAVSVDTWRAPVARAALDAGAVLINDVSGLSDPEIASACAASGAGLVITHTRAAPKTRAYPDPSFWRGFICCSTTPYCLRWLSVSKSFSITE